MTVKYYLQNKKEGFEVRKRKDLKIKPNNNSSDFVMPSFIHGCPAMCAYCYCARHNKFGNPITQFSNIDEILELTIQHSQEVGVKKIENQQDSFYYVYEIGEESDLLGPQNIDLANYAMNRLIMDGLFIKTTFATKLSNKHNVSKLIDCPRHRQGRIRVSLMPQKVSSILEPGTCLIKDRIKSIDKIYNKGYEVHINFAPVIMYNTWVEDYLQLFSDIHNYLESLEVATRKRIQNQLACEIIFLTHHPKLHKSNLQWNEEAEKLLWQPNNQEFKVNKRGGTDILRYKLDIKKPAMKVLFGALKKHMPYCTVRYAF